LCISTEDENKQTPRPVRSIRHDWLWVPLETTLVILGGNCGSYWVCDTPFDVHKMLDGRRRRPSSKIDCD
jgi:hypothetical protein